MILVILYTIFEWFNQLELLNNDVEVVNMNPPGKAIFKYISPVSVTITVIKIQELQIHPSWQSYS